MISCLTGVGCQAVRDAGLMAHVRQGRWSASLRPLRNSGDCKLYLPTPGLLYLLDPVVLPLKKLRFPDQALTHSPKLL